MSLNKLRSRWSSRLPDLDDSRTHWLLECDGGSIASTEDLTEALDFVEANRGRCAEIHAYRGVIAESGQIVKDTDRRYLIWDRSNPDM